MTSDLIKAVEALSQQPFMMRSDEWIKGYAQALVEVVQLIRQHTEQPVLGKDYGGFPDAKAASGIGSKEQPSTTGQPDYKTMYETLLGEYHRAITTPMQPSATPHPQPDTVPYDVNIEGVVFKKGVSLKALIEAAIRWKKEAAKAMTKGIDMDAAREELAILPNAGEVSDTLPDGEREKVLQSLAAAICNADVDPHTDWAFYISMARAVIAAIEQRYRLVRRV